jgi:folate-binding Fe-S cluster repair protein YgfZ
MLLPWLSRRGLASGLAAARPWSCCALPDRAVLRVRGLEAAPFLQGLQTNDINLLVEGQRKRY